MGQDISVEKVNSYFQDCLCMCVYIYNRGGKLGGRGSGESREEGKVGGI